MPPGDDEPARTGGAVSIIGLRKEFDGVTAVDGIDLEIAAGEFFTLLGPSGCGKTTTLRMVGGFEQPTDGQILLDGVDVAQSPPHKRPVNTVFQSYALFPHLDVGKNVAYGLRWRKDLDKPAREARVARALELVRLSELSRRRPHQLSGGQQQRVALARALVLEPSVLLLDEPLGALDAKLRHSLRSELATLQDEVGITFVLVTHDQEEALEMSSRLAVMNHGRIVQLGTPQEVYREPRTEFVADFLGVANLLEVDRLPGGGSTSSTTSTTCPVRYGEFTLEARTVRGGDAAARRAVIRPECVEVQEAGSSGANRIPGMVDRVVFLGSTTQLMVRLPHGEVLQSLVTNTATAQTPAPGQSVTLHLPSESLRLLASGDQEEPAAAG